MALTVSPLSYRSVTIVDPITGNQATVVAGALQTSGGGGGGGSVTQGTVPWVVSGQGTAGVSATGVVTVQGIASGTAVPVSLAANQSVNVAQFAGTTTSVNNGAVDAGTLRVTLANNSTGIVALTTGAATIGALVANQSVNTAQINGVTPLMGNGTSGTGAQRVTIASDSTGQIALASGTQVQLIPGTSGGLSLTRTIIPNNTTNLIIKGSAGQLYAISAFNNSATIAYIKAYNATSATAGSGTPVDTFMIPAPAAGGGGGIIWSVPAGVAYGTGITLIVTTGIADNDTTAPAASTYIVTAYYK